MKLGKKLGMLGAAITLLATSAAAQTDPPPDPAAAQVAAPAPDAVPPPQDGGPVPPPLPPAPPPPPPSVTWQVEQRFRLWNLPIFDANQRAEAEDLYQALAGPSDPNQVHNRIVAFVRTHKALQSKGYWDPDTRTHKAGFVYPKTYVVQVWLMNAADYVGQTCVWSTTVGKLDRQTAPCENRVAVTLPAAMDHGVYGAKMTAVTVTTSSGATDAETISVRDRLIVSFGDSFASGEGNPDVPSDLKALSGGWGVDGGNAYKQAWVGRNAMKDVTSPAWIDTACHRSSFNQHLVAALKYASDRPHEAVTFLTYACSGAAIFDGLLTPQVEPPGYRDRDNIEPQDVSQIEMAARDLCPPDATGWSSAEKGGQRVFQRTIEKTRWDYLNPWARSTAPVSSQTFTCREQGPKRRVDAVLLSSGGNDAGFSLVIMWALLPKETRGITNQALLNFLRQNKGFAREPSVAARIIGDTLLPDSQTLAARLRELAPNAPVILGGYPSPVRDTANNFCGPVQKTQKDAERHPANMRLIAVKAAMPEGVANLKTWKIVIDRQDARQVEPVVVIALNNQLETVSELTRWKFVKSGADKLAGHGWCAGDAVMQKAVLPDYNPDVPDWTPWRPQDWDPYALQDRFFRTPNDAALTQRPENPRAFSGMDQNSRALLASFAGSFHPTFQGHVVMGLDLANALRDLPQ